MAQRGPTRPTARIEEAIGFVGAFGVLFLVVTVSCELTGRPALGWALTLLACVLAVVALDRWRVRVLRRQDDDGSGTAAEFVPVRSGSSRDDQPGPDGRVHGHVGWDEVERAGRARRAGRPRRERRDGPAGGGGPGPTDTTDAPAGPDHGARAVHPADATRATER
ncbi:MULTISPECIES: hypothetical protein [unclassified Curtobacterium]|uniref:hypothetical protein n=1 Tax=unclassified Curtobacterium TaxID=257496 RepID=UPI0008DDC3C3|nr:MULTISPECIES: hypothetical protein [unclassified Curtobacterium]OIH97114.1 hypothetical protein BIU92_16145 [Curtobacterium sp. MCBA15_003]OII32976.1 hypothetical protein BIU94_15775 [Curtobacterium sp. MMLR14_006]